MDKLTRREALRSIGAAAGAAIVAPRLLGCGDDQVTPGSITTIVTLMMENRSYDHYLGSRKLDEHIAGDGLVAGMQNPDLAGAEHAIYRETVDCIADPPHGWDSSRAQWNNGQNDGFVKQYQIDQGDGSPPYVMGYFGRTDLPVYYALADASTTCDRWFASVMGPTWPNRFYLHCAQSNGLMSNVVPGTAFPSIYDKLNAARIDWAYYFSDLPFLGLLQGIDSSKFKHVNNQFFNDAAAGTLPPVVMIDPAFSLNDDHPPHHPLLGEQFIGAIYNALAASPQWKNLLFVVTYDEHGGFFDHVSPPQVPDDRAALGFNQLGFRVPTLITGPYARKGFVSSVQHDHTSVVRHIEKMFGLDALTMRDAAANDLSDAIDADRLARGDAAPPVTLPVVTVDQSMLDPLCLSSDFKRSDIELYADAGGFPPEMDLRGQVRDLAYEIAARSGGIRR